MVDRKASHVVRTTCPREALSTLGDIERRLDGSIQKEDSRLSNMRSHIGNWNRLQTKLAQKLNVQPEETLLSKSQWEFRKRVERAQVLDLAQDLPTKYGGYRGWQLGLRCEPN